MIVSRADIARLRSIQFELARLQEFNIWNKTCRPTNETEAEAFLNINEAISALVFERAKIISASLRKWPGWKSYEQLKAEQEKK